MEVFVRPKEPNIVAVRVKPTLYPAFVERLEAEECTRNALMNNALDFYLKNHAPKQIEKTPA